MVNCRACDWSIPWSVGSMLMVGAMLAGCQDAPTSASPSDRRALFEVQVASVGIPAAQLPQAEVIAAVTDAAMIPFVLGIAYAGEPEQVAVLTVQDAGFPANGPAYLIISSGDARDPRVDGYWNWYPSPWNPGCVTCYPGTGDSAALSISIALPLSAIAVEFDYRFFTADDVEWVRPSPWYDRAFVLLTTPSGLTLGGMGGSPWTIANCGYSHPRRCTSGFTWFPDGVQTGRVDVRAVAGQAVVLRASAQDWGSHNRAQTGVALDGLRLVLSNLPPIASAGGPYTANEGMPFTLDGTSSSDPEGGPVTYAWDLDADEAFDDATSATISHTFPENGSYPVALRVTDAQGASATVATTVTVLNVAPTVRITGPITVQPVLGRASVPLQIQFTDPGADTHTAIIDCDNGLPVINRASVSSPFEHTCSYTSSAFGARSIRVTVTDDDGGAGALSHGVGVLYQWNGFFAPIENAPAVNVAKAGSAVPVKFALDGYQGLDIAPPGSPTSQRTSCAASLIGVPEATLTPRASRFSYDHGTGQYQYVWKTEKAWTGTCRQVILTLQDGTVHQAEFRFK